jgi:FtsH-binding integral membrane protein
VAIVADTPDIGVSGMIENLSLGRPRLSGCAARIFAGWTAFDFQRLRRSQDIRTAPLLAASIFLDILSVFQLFLLLFGRDD